MRQGYAFEFVGSIGSDFGDFSDRAQQTVDALGALFHDGLNLLGVVGSVVNLIELKKTTRLMDQTYNSKLFNDFIRQYRESCEAQTEAAERAAGKVADIRSRLRRSEAEELIQKARNELLAEQEVYRQDVERKIGDVSERMAKVTAHVVEAQKLRNIFQDSLCMSRTVMEILMENEIKNRQKIAQLEENIRRVSNNYFRTFENSI